MDDGIERRNDGDRNMDEDGRNDVIVLGELPVPPLPKIRQVDVDARSRDAFEMLKLSEAICNLQADQRKLRLNAEDMRFERDRYKASAASFQDKLVEALNENARLRDLREVLKTFSAQMDGARGQHEAVEELRRENARLEHELQESKAQAERMRLAFIDLTRGLIDEVQSTREQAVE